MSQVSPEGVTLTPIVDPHSEAESYKVVLDEKFG